MDIVVLFDMSRSGPGASFDAGADAGKSFDLGAPIDSGKSFDLLAHFEQTRDYISGAFLKEFLRKGDTFHLISFGETPRIELSRRIEGEGDYRTIIGRLLLLYPLAQTSSLENAAAYAERFIAELPPARQKKVVFFTAQGAGAELGTYFNSENTDVYMAAIPASFGTLASGRAMMKAPPVLTPPVSDGVEQTEPASLSTIEPPVLNVLPLNPPDITAAPVSPEFRLIWDGDDEPVLFDKIKAMTIILPMAGIILLSALVLGCAVTWKKRDRTERYTIEDFLYQISVNAALEDAEDDTRYAIPARGLLQKADEMKEQLA
jgi:hypothetical protein